MQKRMCCRKAKWWRKRWMANTRDAKKKKKEEKTNPYYNILFIFVFPLFSPFCEKQIQWSFIGPYVIEWSTFARNTTIWIYSFLPPFTVANCRTLKYINLFSFVHNVHSFGGMWEHSKILQNMMSKIRFGTKHFVHKYSFINLDADLL